MEYSVHDRLDDCTEDPHRTLPHVRIGTGDGKGGIMVEVARLVEAPVSASVGGSMQRACEGKWKKMLGFVKLKGEGRGYT